MRRLVGLVLAACLIGFVGPRSVHAGEEAATPGLWINPELGLATPEDAAARYKAPFHTWLSEDGDHEESDWRQRIFFRFTRDSRDGGPDLSRKVASCAVMRAAWRNGFRSTYRMSEPGSLLNGRWSYQILKRCETLEHLSRLRPIKARLEEHPDYLANAWTVRHLSPLAYAGVSMESLCSGYRSEVRNEPHLALRDRYAAHGGGYVFHGLIHERPWDDTMKDGDNVWAVWSETSSIEVAGLQISPRIRLESEHSVTNFTVQGVGALMEHGRTELVVLIEEGSKAGGTIWPVDKVVLLSYEPAIQIFRVVNLEDFKRELDDYDCLPDERG